MPYNQHDNAVPTVVLSCSIAELRSLSAAVYILRTAVFGSSNASILTMLPQIVFSPKQVTKTRLFAAAVTYCSTNTRPPQRASEPSKDWLLAVTSTDTRPQQGVFSPSEPPKPYCCCCCCCDMARTNNRHNSAVAQHPPTTDSHKKCPLPGTTTTNTTTLAKAR